MKNLRKLSILTILMLNLVLASNFVMANAFYSVSKYNFVNEDSETILSLECKNLSYKEMELFRVLGSDDYNDVLVKELNYDSSSKVLTILGASTEDKISINMSDRCKFKN